MVSSKFKIQNSKSKVQASEHWSAAKGRLTTGYRLPATGYSGFTLLEVLVAMAVLAVALISLLGLYNRSLMLTMRAQQLNIAMLLAQEMLSRTQLEGAAAQVSAGNFSDLHPGRYSEFRWQRTIRPTPLKELWEIRVSVSWGNRADESCELTLFTPLEGL